MKKLYLINSETNTYKLLQEIEVTSDYNPESVLLAACDTYREHIAKGEWLFISGQYAEYWATFCIITNQPNYPYQIGIAETEEREMLDIVLRDGRDLDMSPGKLLELFYKSEGVTTDEDKAEFKFLPTELCFAFEGLVNEGVLPENLELALTIKNSYDSYVHMNSKYVLFKGGVPIYAVPLLSLVVVDDKDDTNVRPNDAGMMKLFDVALRANVEVSDHCDYRTYWTVGLPV
ncbi:hypothetical protein ABES02_29825 [Neobacillus pocheonensis]|uniref:hypothetical protein n=1 Tax=Neobacillus pocheonensis TaxID=363869 RepID=UPI003D2B7575